MPYRENAPHVVIPCRPGDNRELRFALRSIERNFDYGHIWIAGAWPDWLNTTHPHLTAVKRPLPQGGKYAATRSHYRWACRNPAVSDPWVLWNDDFYCMRPVTDLPAIHRGKCVDVSPMFSTWKSKWAHGMRETEKLMRRIMPRQTLYNYDIHTPLLIHKRVMLRALDLAERLRIHAPHVRTLYGNLAKLGGVTMRDPKIDYARPQHQVGAWLSSQEHTFRSSVEAMLTAAGLDDPSAFELPGVPDRTPYRPTPGSNDARKSARKRGMRYRVIPDQDGRRRVVREETTQPVITPPSRHNERREQMAAAVTTARKGKTCRSCGR